MFHLHLKHRVFYKLCNVLMAIPKVSETVLNRLKNIVNGHVCPNLVLNR